MLTMPPCFMMHHSGGYVPLAFPCNLTRRTGSISLYLQMRSRYCKLVALNCSLTKSSSSTAHYNRDGLQQFLASSKIHLLSGLQLSSERTGEPESIYESVNEKDYVILPVTQQVLQFQSCGPRLHYTSG